MLIPLAPRAISLSSPAAIIPDGTAMVVDYSLPAVAARAIDLFSPAAVWAVSMSTPITTTPELFLSPVTARTNGNIPKIYQFLLLQ